jgi:hypothetical protein
MSYFVSLGALGALGAGVAALVTRDARILLFAVVLLGSLAAGGAAGGLMYHWTGALRSRGPAAHTLANVVTLLTFCAATMLALFCASLIVFLMVPDGLES